METPIGWADALADYQRLRALSDALGSGHEEMDASVDAYCEAADSLIMLTAAPDLHAVIYKLRLAEERAEGFEMSGDYIDAPARDLDALAAMGA
ncbi:hypothetical protein [Sphingomonas jatrophae]|nr:hypothetical protein [Sphingomonas jatrophae]